MSTGIVLALDGKRSFGAGEVFMIFDSLDDLERYALSETGARPDVECAAYDHRHRPVAIYRGGAAVRRW